MGMGKQMCTKCANMNKTSLGWQEKQLDHARLAQSAEHETLNLGVVGSSPTLGDLFFLRFLFIFERIEKERDEGKLWKNYRKVRETFGNVGKFFMLGIFKQENWKTPKIPLPKAVFKDASSIPSPWNSLMKSYVEYRFSFSVETKQLVKKILHVIAMTQLRKIKGD
jgi:hypothetical protein